MTSVPGFVGAGLDRADWLRSDKAAYEEALNRRDARLLRMQGVDPMAGPDGRLEWVSLAEAPLDAELVLIGLDGAIPHFAMVPPAGSSAVRPSPHLWQMIAGLSPDEAATFAAARSTTDWHARHRFCAKCGSPTKLAKAGWQRSCTSCNAEHFPRTDPVVIMLAEHDGRVLVGRQHAYPPGRYSALAGFVEPGESLEGAVIRELKEEAGIDCRDVRYVASQPWPFPSSMMIGCMATADDDTLTLDTTEIEDAFWVTREEVAAAIAEESGTKFIAPPKLAIANTLFRRWLGEG